MADKKVIDVTQPKDAKVDIGSKPMIVGHKSMASDPMMREAEEEKAHESANSEDTKVIEEVSKSDPLIAPPSERQKTIEPLKSKAEMSAEPKKSAETKKSDEKQDDAESESKEEVEVDPTVKALEQEEVIRKLLEEKKYHVSIKQARNTNKTPLYVAIGLLVAGMLAAFVLIDMKKLDIGVTLPFSIFGDDTETVTTTTPAVATPEAKPVVLESASWLKYDAENYTIRIPDGWVVTSVDGSLSITSYDQMSYKLGESGVVIQEKTVTESDCCFFVSYYLDDTKLSDYTDESKAYTATPVILHTGVQAIRYERVLSVDESETRPAGSKIYEYVIKNDAGNNVVVTYVMLPESTVSIDTLEMSVKSVIIN